MNCTPYAMLLSFVRAVARRCQYLGSAIDTASSGNRRAKSTRTGSWHSRTPKARYEYGWANIRREYAEGSASPILRASRIRNCLQLPHHLPPKSPVSNEKDNTRAEGGSSVSLINGTKHHQVSIAGRTPYFSSSSTGKPSNYGVDAKKRPIASSTRPKAGSVNNETAPSIHNHIPAFYQ
jgi:hypothetical protein